MAKEFVPILANRGNNTFVPIPANRVESETEEESDQTVIGSIARGTGAGLVNIAQGISELGAAGLEATDLVEEGSQEATTKAFEDFKTSFGLTPERTAGKITETIVNYATPGLGVFSWVSKADKARRALKSGTAIADARTRIGRSAQAFGRTNLGKATTSTGVGRAGLTTIGTGVADVLVSPSTNTTLADSWDAMPDELRTEDEEGLTGMDLSGVRLRNKFRLGVEGMMFNAAGEAVLPVAGASIKAIGNVPGVPALARGISNGLDFLGDGIKNIPYVGPRVQKFLTPDGLAPSEVMTAVRTADGITENEQRIAAGHLRDYDRATKKLISLQKVPGLGKARAQRTHNETFDFLTGEMTPEDFSKAHGKKALKAAEAMRDQIVRLSDTMKKSLRDSNLSEEEVVRIAGVFEANQGQYLRRLYEINLRPEKFRGLIVEKMPNYKGALAEVEQAIINKNRRLDTLPEGHPGRAQIVGDPRLEAEQMMQKRFNQVLENQGVLAPDAKQSNVYLAKGAEEVRNKARGDLFKLSTNMLESRSGILDESPMFREMMGEIKDPRDAYLHTISDMTNTIVSQRLYQQILDDVGSTGVNDGLARLRSGQGARPIIEGADIADDSPLSNQIKGYGYTKLSEFVPAEKAADDAAEGVAPNIEGAFGGKYGALSGKFVPNEIYNSLTTPIRANNASQEALAVALQLKGLSQMSKTVLNPLSQVRNFLSNTFVIGANGLLGRNMGVFESAEVLTSGLGSPEQYKLLKAMSEEGAIGQNIQLNELQQLLKEQTEIGVSARLRQGGEAFKKSALGAPVRFMQKTYQLGDDYWKVVGALGEKARYGAALRKADLDIDALDDATQQALVNVGIVPRTSSIAGTDFGNLLATDIVKQTMPTYSMVPEAIKSLRRIPVMGNFMAFPAEIIRTSGNVVNRSVKEMGITANDLIKAGIKDPAQARILARQIRGIGAQRLTGYISMATVAPVAMRDAAHSVLDITPEEEQLLEENKPYWSVGNTMMYLTKPKDGKAEYADLSYMLPYDFMLAPARAALEVYSRTGEVSDSTSEQIFNGAWAGFKKFAEPFASEAMATERLLDVTIRQGKTQTGSKIYEPAEMWGDKFSKSMTHMVGAFMPGILDQLVTVKSGKFEPGRATRAAVGLPSASGDPYIAAEEAGAMLTGIRPMKLNVSRSLGYDGGAYLANRTSASSIFTRVADDNDVTEQDVLDAYVQANEARRRHQGELKVQIDKAMAAGMSRGEVFQAFKQTGVTRKELRNILNNRFDPIKVSRSLIREVAREVNVKRENRILKRVPTQAINAVRRTYINTPIITTESETNIAPPVQSGFVPILSNRPTQPVATTPAPQPAESFLDRATGGITDMAGDTFQRIQSIAPTILGGDIATQSANTEILRRSQQGQ